ncbi:MAG: hypothetical protein RLP12_14210 [Ekhidna sp.]
MPSQEAQFPTKRFNHEPTGVIVICNGVKELIFMTPDAFKAVEARYNTPKYVGYSRCYEYRIMPDGSQELAVHAEGEIFHKDNNNPGKPAIWPEGEEYIANLARYETLQAEREHPLFGITDLAQAKEISSQALINHMRGLTFNAIGVEYTEEERATWPLQLEEAKIWSADNAVPTPLLDFIRQSSETKEEQVSTIIKKSNVMRIKIAPFIKVRREKVGILWSLNTIAEIKEFYDNQIETGWTADQSSFVPGNAS